MIKLLELRERAMDRLGDQFSLTEFQNVVLSNGGVPLEVLEGVVDDQIQAKLSQGTPEQAVTLASSSPRK